MSDEVRLQLARRYLDLYGSNIEEDAFQICLAEMERLRKKLVESEKVRKQALASIEIPESIQNVVFVRATTRQWKLVATTEEVWRCECVANQVVMLWHGTMLGIGLDLRSFEITQCHGCNQVRWRTWTRD